MHKIRFIIIVLFAVSCQRYPAGVERALKLAGDNRAELERVLEHYRSQPEDSLKYRAACFLIANMPGHASVAVQLKDSSGSLYTGFVANGHEYDSLIRTGFKIVRTIEPDIEHAGCSWLTGQIDLAFEAWAKPWSRHVAFGDFCRYILPYRAQTEPLSSARGEFLRTYGHILDTVPGLTDPLEACRIINRVLRDSIRYHVGLMQVPMSRSIEDVKNSGLGQCDDMCNFGIHVMRAAGIPVAVEKTLWARMNSAHSWCSVPGSDGRWHAFGPGEKQPGELIAYFAAKPQCTLAKVYRITYEYQEDTRRDSLLKTSIPPALFSSSFARDITSEYVHTPAVTAPVDKPEAYSFLCVFNWGYWNAVDYSPVKRGQATFTAGTGVIYMNHIFRNGELYPCSEPFLLEGDSVRKLIPDFDRTCKLTLVKKQTVGEQLKYWDTAAKTWKGITCSGSNDTELFFDSVPGNALLWHYAPGWPQRIGIVKDGTYKNY